MTDGVAVPQSGFPNPLPAGTESAGGRDDRPEPAWQRGVSMDATNRNWAGNIDYGAQSHLAPGSLDEVREAVRRATRLRAVGSRHSFNRIAATDATQLSLHRLNRLIGIGRNAATVTVEGGITYSQLSPALHDHGLALRNLASLPHISVAGAVATATHGSGDRNGNLATAVAGLEIVTADGEILHLERGDPAFEGAVVSLGALGIVTEITLDVMPTFDVRQDVYLDLPFATLVERFDELTASAYSVSFFTAWRGDTVDQVWLKSHAAEPFALGKDFHGARLADRKWHPIGSMDPTTSTEQLGIAGAWHQRLPHFRIDLTPSAGEELQSEYFVARKDAPGAFEAINRIRDRFSPLLYISEIRTIAADDLWMSTAYRQDSVGLHFTFKPDWPNVQKVLPLIEQALAPFSPRPHWGKLFATPAPEVRSRYARLDDFRALLARHDPAGKFRNAFLDELLF